MTVDVARALGRGSVEFLPEEDLLAYVTAQRWYGSKSREAVDVQVLDHAVLRSEPPLLVDALAEVRFSSGSHEVYHLLIGVSDSAPVPDEAVIATAKSWTAYDAFPDRQAARELIHRVRSGGTVAAQDGTLEFRTLSAIPQEDALREVRPLGLEQSNTSVVLDESLILKAYRRIEAGVNPELELHAFLTQRGFPHIAELQGWWGYSGPLMDATLGIVQRYLVDAVDGWTLALRELSAAPDAFLGRLHRLGEVVGRMHAVLASDPDDPAFSPEQKGPEALALLTATIDEEIEDVFSHLPEVDAVAPLVGRGDEMRDVLRGLAQFGPLGRAIRHHGDLHLGQALWSGGDWALVDFEGEPARPLPDRRRKRSPLRDVAGMLRSFSYAASAAELEEGAAFEERARSEFLTAYLAAAHGAGVLPESDEATGRLITIFELEKALYELRYELNNRPEWLPVPVRSILRLLEEAPQ